MTGGPAAVTAEIDRRLTAAAAAGSPNRITATQLRAWAVDYLLDQDVGAVRFPVRGGRRHWNLWMRGLQSADALFAVLVFRPTGIEFFCGTGPGAEVRRFCEAGVPADPDALYPALRDRFPIPEEPLRLDRPTAEAWLGRPRPW